MTRTLTLLIVLMGCLLASCGAPLESYDIAILNARVMDPETGFDQVRNVGVRDDVIATITADEIKGLRTIDAAGNVAAPGFIDLHQHGQSPVNYRAQIHDGITTALELEIGVEDIPAWYAEREGNALVNHGASISHPYSRNIAMTGENPGLSGDAMAQPLADGQLEALEERIQAGLEAGAVAVGFGIAYTPGATLDEITAIFKLAARYNAVCHVHMRTAVDLTNLEEVLTAAKDSGASLHVVHLNSSSRDEAPKYLARIREAQAEGIDVTTECYPYNRGSTRIDSHSYSDWETYSDEELGQFTWVETGENLTRETFRKYRAQGGTIISPPTYSLETVKLLVADPLTMIASDGMWIDNGRAHPRTWGTFSRVLGHYVREEGALTLMDALGKMTVRPAQRLEKRIPAMNKKGRLQEGADADIVVFDPESVIDRATFDDPVQYSAGIRYVLVNGALTLDDGELVAGVAAGEAIRASRAR